MSIAVKAVDYKTSVASLYFLRLRRDWGCGPVSLAGGAPAGAFENHTTLTKQVRETWRLEEACAPEAPGEYRVVRTLS